MTCEDAGELLPELAAGELSVESPVREHVAGCAACTHELAEFRALHRGLAGLGAVVVAPPVGFLGRVLAEIPSRHWRFVLARAVGDARVHHAAFSFGGAVIGATAVALISWRALRRRALGPIQAVE